MYKVLLVDDEVLIREAISENIKWEELGYTFLGACEDGRQAMEKINEEAPDLLITDICMPYVDGMELTKFVSEKHPKTKVIIVSGYDEFDYAKQAVKYKVLEYVLKPVTAYELSELLERVKEDFDKESDKDNNLKKIRKAYMSSLPMIKGKYLNNLIMGKTDSFSKNDEKQEFEFRMDLSGKYFSTGIVEWIDSEEYAKKDTDINEDLMRFAIYNISDEIVSKYGCGTAFHNVEEDTIIIFKGDKKDEFIENVKKICEEIKEALKSYLGIKVVLVVGKNVPTLNWLNKSFETAKEASEYTFLYDEGDVVLDATVLEEIKSKKHIEISEYVEKISLGIKSADSKQIRNVFQQLEVSLKENYVSRNKAYIYIQNILLTVNNAIDLSGIKDEAILEEQHNIIEDIYKAKFLKDIIAKIADYCIKVADIINNEKESGTTKQALMAMDYIDKNYGNSEISLNSVCTYLSISTSYFSTIFKNYAGVTFIEALTRKRIEKAKQLIENTSMKTYEIADEVGFADPHYFSITFKKNVGVTPTEYAKLKR